MVARNLLPALVPLALVAAIAFSSSRARRLGLACATVLCAYWLGYAVHVALTPNLQRPGPPRPHRTPGPAPAGRERSSAGSSAADPIRFYLHDRVRTPLRPRGPAARNRRRQQAAGAKASLATPTDVPPVERVGLERLTLTRSRAKRVH